MEEKYWGEKNSPVKKAVNNKEITEKHIAVHENKIYYYAGVNRESAAELNKKIGELQVRSFTMANNLDVEPYPIHLHINSGGGSLISGIASMDTILRCKVPVYTYVDGFAASAATFLSIVGNKRFISRHSYMLIHQLSSNFWGKYSEFQDAKQNLDLMMDTIKNVYKKYTKVPVKKLNEILKHDLMWDAETCLKYGLVDEII
ncbi:Clp protease ClpP [Candidatus Woesearchaeota archaeon]|jgi:ATP-dependent protease ClpP protease subunit|nr:Clp protease ClpP [Candidatus Woesearchaeota archaeon]